MNTLKIDKGVPLPKPTQRDTITRMANGDSVLFDNIGDAKRFCMLMRKVCLGTKSRPFFRTMPAGYRVWKVKRT